MLVDVGVTSSKGKLVAQGPPEASYRPLEGIALRWCVERNGVRVDIEILFFSVYMRTRKREKRKVVWHS